MSVNKVILIGRLGKDPEGKVFENGTQVTSFSLATSEKWTDKSGERKERTEWTRVVMFGKLAEIAKKYLTKGREVYIEGKIQTRSWDDNGTTKYATEVFAQHMHLLGSGQKNDQPGQASQDYTSTSGLPNFAPNFDQNDQIPY